MSSKLPALSIFTRASACTSGPTTATLSAADKFTHKWPRPRTLRKGTGVRARARGAWTENEMRGALVEGKGLGIEGWGKWTTHKWVLLFSIITVFTCAMMGLVISVLTWFAAYPAAPVVLVTDVPCVVLLTFSSSLLLLASVFGFAGTLLNSRPILAVYVLLLIPAATSLVSVGYVSYHKSIYSLDGKLSEAWNDFYTPAQRALLQGALKCCGWVDTTHMALSSGVCFPRAALPGCRDVLGAYERRALATLYGIVFSLVPLLLVDVAAGVLCANHVTHRFGKGITPKQYRLNVGDVIALSRAGSVSSTRTGTRVVVDKPRVARVAETGASVFREDKELPALPPGLEGSEL
ncbi:hypothetical protein K488DRAFT_41460 [Vararia minispora EC-137]|uniref:Uncharacterized protein n=1 Tax=Vararia minispora EC-137 TaxID=1314806 RepID=A0ACB8QX95_9AGAM|nr:hypothetical protein K488DRAFT_41460 [Vararia minispora EC-137]